MPRSGPLNTAPGNFDFPPASASSDAPNDEHSDLAQPAPDYADFPARLQGLRHELERERIQVRRTREIMDNARRAEFQRRPSPMSRPQWAMPARQPSRLRHERGTQSPPLLPSSSTHGPGPRPRATPSERFRRLGRLRPEQATSEILSSSSQMHQTGDHLAQFNNDIRSVLGRHLGPLASTSNEETAELDGSRDHVENRRKRRKLENAPPRKLGFKYGYYGQIVPGKLKMELVSGDGGAFKEGSEAENVLWDDSSYYRASSSQCNLVLKHQEETTFCLEKLDIKTPESNTPDSVQEGIVFVSMKKDDVLDSTTRYPIFDFPSCQLAGYFASQRPRDSQSQASDSDLPETDRRLGADLRQPPPDDHHDCDEEECNHPAGETDHQTAPSASGSGSDSGDDSESDRESDRLAVAEWDAPAAQSQPPPTLHPPPVAISSVLDNFNFNTWLLSHDDGRDPAEVPSLPASTAPPPRRRPPRTLTPTDLDRHHLERLRDLEAATTRTALQAHRDAQRQATHDAIYGDTPMLAPAARFSMRRASRKLSIRFDPPVSARYVLLKLWAPQPGQSVDVQSIVCHGFAGPRYWPAMEMR